MVFKHLIICETLNFRISINYFQRRLLSDFTWVLLQTYSCRSRHLVAENSATTSTTTTTRTTAATTTSTTTETTTTTTRRRRRTTATTATTEGDCTLERTPTRSPPSRQHARLQGLQLARSTRSLY